MAMPSTPLECALQGFSSGVLKAGFGEGRPWVVVQIGRVLSVKNHVWSWMVTARAPLERPLQGLSNGMLGIFIGLVHVCCFCPGFQCRDAA
jgi:hypothetical protein